ncbi:MAG: type II/IV secretion system ATPase subunit [Candidatus Hadarchaeales archaeon]
MGERKGCSFGILRFGRRRVLRFGCDSCGEGADPGVSGRCMEGLLRGLAECPQVEEVQFPGAYEREYAGRELEGMRRLALLLSDWELRSMMRTCRGCGRCEEERRGLLASLSLRLSRSPLEAREELEGHLRELEVASGRGSARCRECRSSFLTGFLRPMRGALERICGEVFQGGRFPGPRLRPSFMFSRLGMDPPPGAELVERYGLRGGEVRIYLCPRTSQFLYFLLPRECSLPPELVRLMYEVREALSRDPPPLEGGPELLRGRIQRLAARRMAEEVGRRGLEVGKEEIDRLSESLARFTAGLGVLELLLSDERVQDVYLDAPPGETPLHLYHQDFEECLTNVYPSEEEAEALVSRLRALSGRPFSEADPVLEAELGGVRVTAIGPPLSPDGKAFSFRRHRSSPWTLPQFVRAGFLDPPTASLLSLLVDAQASLLLTGTRGSGKTSLLTSLLFELPPKFRILLLEDTPELPAASLRSLGFKVQTLRTRSPLGKSEVEPSAEEALRAALRLGESVLVVGEVRGPEARTLFEAMRVGAAGNCVMGTIHGASAEEVFERVVHDLGVQPSSFAAVDAVVASAPIRPLGGLKRRRRVVQVAEVVKVEEVEFRELVRYEVKGDRFVPGEVEGSGLLRSLARRWGMGLRALLSHWRLRESLLATLVRTSVREGRADLLEAEFVFRSNQRFRSLWEEEVRSGEPKPERVRERWERWLRESLR